MYNSTVASYCKNCGEELDEGISEKESYTQKWSDGNAKTDADINNRSEDGTQIWATVEEPSEEAKQHLEKGLSKVGSKGFDEAIEDIDKATSLHPDYLEAWQEKGIINCLKGDFDEGIRCFEKVISINPNLFEGWFWKASAYHAKEEYDKVIRCLDKGLSIDPSYSKAWYSKGLAHREKGELKEAMRCLDKAIEKDQEHLDAWYMKGVIHRERGELKKAEVHLKRAHSIDPDDPRVESELAELEEEMDVVIESG